MRLSKVEMRNKKPLCPSFRGFIDDDDDGILLSLTRDIELQEGTSILWGLFVKKNFSMYSWDDI